MKDLNCIAADLSKGKHLDENLDKYIRGMASLYNGYAYIKLSMNYYTVYDMMRDDADHTDVYTDVYRDFNDVISKLIAGEPAADEVVALRERIIADMDVVVAFIDRLRIYEHILNRVEYRFKDSDFDSTYYNTYFTNELMHYILSDKDNVVVNGKIASVIGQLPMRLSRQSFYEHLKGAYSLYHGAQKGTIDDFTYSLRTTSLLTEPDGYRTLMPQMADIIDELASTDYAALDSDGYDKLHGLLEEGAERANRCADYYVLLVSMVNDVYSIVLSDKLSLGANTETELARSIIAEINKAELANGAVDDSLVERFVQFEGKQERILGTIAQCDYCIHEFGQAYPDELAASGRAQDFETLEKITKLQSGSDFVQLRAADDYDTVPDNEYADGECEKLIGELASMFADSSVQVRRAIMATVLSQLPVFFNNTEEIQGYINVSLMQCSDIAEQKATVEILKSLMEG